MKLSTISAIAAIGKNRELGKSGKLPWHIPEELKFFKRVTTGHPIIMGRKTHESIGRALPRRTNIIITRNSEYQAQGCIVVSSVENAITEAEKHEGAEEIFIIGGGEIYKLSWKYINKLYLTKVDASFDADVYFPEYSSFSKVLAEDKRKSSKYSFTIYELEK
jgi:dihydrofolate reductase